MKKQIPIRNARRVLEHFDLRQGFEVNVGQWPDGVRFLAQSGNSLLVLTADEAVFVLGGPSSSNLRFLPLGTKPGARITGRNRIRARANYFTGDDPAHWRTKVPSFASVAYESLYPGVTLIFRRSGGGFEYDFVLEPHVDPREVRFRFDGASNTRIDTDGSLVVTIPGGELRQPRPFAYQHIPSRNRVEVEYVLDDSGAVGFAVGTYEPRTQLVIDPVIVYSTYLGGSQQDNGFGVAVDGRGNAYVCGDTLSPGFATSGAAQVSLAGGRDAYVAKLDFNGGLVYVTYLGGSQPVGGSPGSVANGIAVDVQGCAYVVGTTKSSNFPTLSTSVPPAPPFQSASASGGAHFTAFVTKLDPAGASLVYSTYLGGSVRDEGYGIAVDHHRCAYVTGATRSPDFPLSNPIMKHCGGWDAFVTKLNPVGTGLIFSTLVGGSGNDYGKAIAVDPNLQPVITGYTESKRDFPVFNAVQPTFGGGASDAFVAQLTAAGTGFVFSTFLGGSGEDNGYGIAVDQAGDIYVTGGTKSTNFPTVAPIQPHNAGSWDAFVTKIRAGGALFVYSTFLGGSKSDVCWGIAVDLHGRAHVVGQTSSLNFPVVNPLQAVYGGGNMDVIIARLDPAGATFEYATYLGGKGTEGGMAIALGFRDRPRIEAAYITGCTDSAGFPVVRAFQPSLAGASDAFVCVIV